MTDQNTGNTPACNYIDATYSAEDNKLRLYAARRLDAETYDRVKAAGYKWAPKQDLFVAPKWTPAREDLALELAGEIEPEGTTVAERAAMKAERLDEIAANKERKANAYHRAASDLSRAFEFGQPILIGHHSERRARKTQERMHSAQSKAADNFKAISYWQYRAASVEHHANRQNRPDVRARRIKTLLAELRDLQRDVNHAGLCLELWARVTTDEQISKLAGSRLKSGGVTGPKAYRAFCAKEIDAQELRTRSLANWEAVIASPFRQRWIEHTLNRLGYERELLGPVARFEGSITPVILQAFAREHGAHKPKGTKQEDGTLRLESLVSLPLHICSAKALEQSPDAWRDLMQTAGYEVPAPKPKAPPILNFRADAMVSKNRWGKDEAETFEQVEMTKADYSNINSEARWTRLSLCGRFRFKVCPLPFFEGPRWQAPRVAVFLTDSKEHPAPATFADDQAED